MRCEIPNNSFHKVAKSCLIFATFVTGQNKVIDHYLAKGKN